MAWTLTGDLGEYLAAAGEFLRSDPVQHTIELAAVEQMRAARFARAWRAIAPAHLSVQRPLRPAAEQD